MGGVKIQRPPVFWTRSLTCAGVNPIEVRPVISATISGGPSCPIGINDSPPEEAEECAPHADDTRPGTAWSIRPIGLAPHFPRDHRAIAAS